MTGTHGHKGGECPVDHQMVQCRSSLHPKSTPKPLPRRGPGRALLTGPPADGLPRQGKIEAHTHHRVRSKVKMRGILMHFDSQSTTGLRQLRPAPRRQPRGKTQMLAQTVLIDTYTSIHTHIQSREVPRTHSYEPTHPPTPPTDRGPHVEGAPADARDVRRAELRRSGGHPRGRPGGYRAHLNLRGDRLLVLSPPRAGCVGAAWLHSRVA